jgi:ferredoxin
MRVQIDTSRCQGHGRCYSVAPDVFESDDEGYGRVLLDDVPESLREKAELGAANCPERAITVEG